MLAWPTLEAAHVYRFKMNATGWADIWALDDHEQSEPSLLMSGDAQARVLRGDIAPEDLELMHSAQ